MKRFRIHQPTGVRSVIEQLGEALSLTFKREGYLAYKAVSFGGTQLLLERRVNEYWELNIVFDRGHKNHEREAHLLGPMDQVFFQNCLPDCLVGVSHGG